MHNFLSGLSSELMQKRMTCMRIRGMASPESMAIMAALRAWRLILGDERERVPGVGGKQKREQKREGGVSMV